MQEQVTLREAGGDEAISESAATGAKIASLRSQ
jgi:hypothetical protein